MTEEITGGTCSLEAAYNAERERLFPLAIKDEPQGEYRKPVFGEGKQSARIILIGEAPGAEETKLGHPFVGKAGKQLDALFCRFGVMRADAYITNVVKYRPVVRSAKTIKNRPPVGLFGNIQTEKRQSSRNSLNLKINGIAPLVDFIRLFSLEKDVHETSTIERIHILKKKHTIIEDFGDDIEQAFEFILLLRMEHQASQIRKFEEPDNYIDYNSLSLLEKKTLKDVFDLITKIQNMIIELYKSLIW